MLAATADVAELDSQGTHGYKQRIQLVLCD
jgi:hypothetical protein